MYTETQACTASCEGEISCHHINILFPCFMTEYSLIFTVFLLYLSSLSGHS